MRKALSAVCLLLSAGGYAQGIQTDSVKELQPVMIQAYATGRPIIEVAAAIGTVDTKSLERFSNTSILPAVNTVPGARMEERSPGSYRFSIRGSLLRSPFGVRNVKVYWNGLPLTDGGGNTYLNLLDFDAIGYMEVIKGPGGSLYGAGTGGVLLMNGPQIKKDQLEVSTVFGSYGRRRFQVGGRIHSGKVNASIRYSHIDYEGYREQTRMSRDAINADIVLPMGSGSSLAATLFYTDLFYETPGGLTQAQYNANPKQARPPGGPNRGAVEQQAAVENKTPFAGVSFEHEWNEYTNTRIGVFGATSDFDNPAIRNYESRDEQNLGARIETSYRFGNELVKGKLTFGAEYQNFRSSIDVYGNNFGMADTTQTKDELTSRLGMVFLQEELDLPLNFYLTLGGSLNYSTVGFTRSHPTSFDKERAFDASFSPRIALLNKITPGFSVYGSVSRGFSPPSIAELYPSRGIFDKNIQAEKGINVETGIRAVDLWKALTFDITAYWFRLKNALVIRRDASLAGEPEYFVNAGKTSQKGIEALVSWNPIRNKPTVISDFKLWNSFAYNDYTFKDYVQGENDLSGNQLTGVSPVINTGGLDLSFKRRIYLNVTATYVDHTPLDDSNVTYANEYLLAGARLGFRGTLSQQHDLDIFTGVDNALDRKYSLGNDLNAVGGRFYNAAPPRNYYIGLRFTFAR